MTAKFSASADGTKVNIGNAAEDALQIDSVAKTIKAVAPYLLKGDIAAQSLANPGYIKLASGLIIQWGTSAPIALGTSGNVTFPIPFPNVCLMVHAIANGTGVGFATQISFNASGATLGHIGGTGSTNGATLYYIAIGY